MSLRGPIFTRHAKYEMRERGITKADVRNALRHQLDEFPGTNKWEGTFVIEGTATDGRRLRVVVEEEDRNRVVSVFRP
jgi:hypothetical protein